MSKLTKITILCIDELQRERTTDFGMEKLFELLNSRYNSANYYEHSDTAKLTVLASNFYPTELEPYLYSRLSGPNCRIVDTKEVPDLRAITAGLKQSERV
jgi:hypothetical protein